MSKPVWGIIGTGWIANDMAQALVKSGKTIKAVSARNPEKTKAFAKKYGIADFYTNYDELLADPEINIIYIATPHSNHYEVMKDALEAGKNVFCEKAITVNWKQLEECMAIAAQKNLAIMDGVTLFHMPLYDKLKTEYLPQMGPIKMIQVNFGSLKEDNPANRFFNPDLAGGALLDIGVYAVSFARCFMSRDPEVVLTTVEKYQTGVDESSGILLKNSAGEIAVISLTMLAKQPKRGLVAGQKGYFEVYDFPRADQATLTISGQDPVSIRAGVSADALEYELEAMEKYAADPSLCQNNLDLICSVMKILTEVRAEWGIKFPFES